ncbi:MAG TPA: hypothetical protein ENI34_03095 [candidate division WOR-3 bacterium]|uniref:Helix-turn-helix domain-containing protein n=1 Tax=candidate division WOR-3 bacterium TaxID=2052148 RepID=A0A9C9EM44_UNCW3|nr:hypothetical protein [candidate division WOR-3 bacterium]
MVNNTERRLKAVRYYLEHDESLRTVASRFRINHVTFYKWVKAYRSKGELWFLSEYRRPWNRVAADLEDRIVFLKEREPGLTLRQAKKVLQKQGFEISVKGIWGVWRRYGYTGFIREKLSGDFPVHYPWGKEAKEKFKLAQEQFTLGRVEDAAAVLNSIPALPENGLVPQIPDSLLNLRRCLEKAAQLYLRIPLRDYVKRVHTLYLRSLRKKYYFSALRMGIIEIAASTWLGRSLSEQMKMIRELKRMFKGKNSYVVHYLDILEGIVSARHQRIKEAAECARKCDALIRRWRKVPAEFSHLLGSLYIHLEDYRRAEYWYLKILERGTASEENIYGGHLAYIYSSKGDYKKAVDLLREVKNPDWAHKPNILFYMAMRSLVNGAPGKALSFIKKSLSLSKKAGVQNSMIRAYFTIASAYCSLGDRKEGERTLKRLLPFVRHKMEKAAVIIDILLNPARRDYNLLRAGNVPPSIKLIYLLKEGDYQRAFSYAKQKGIMVYLHRYIFFFPELVIEFLKRGRSTGLPKGMLQLPVFNKEVPVYNIRFLGKPVLYKNQRYLRTRLSPKESAFIIHLSLKAGEPGRRIFLNELYRNFWKTSTAPGRNLSHLLVRVRKALKIPLHLLQISRRGGEAVLVNNGIHFLTDYSEFDQSITAARAFERAGEWEFALKEYSRAFSLFRGEPFMKMYDAWSDQMRTAVLNMVENVLTRLCTHSAKTGDTYGCRRLLEKAGRLGLITDDVFQKLYDFCPKRH